MANALIPSEITLWYKYKKATDPETGEETQAVIRQPSLGWNVDDGIFGIFVSENQLYMIPTAELEGILVEYTDAEEDADVDESAEGLDGEAGLGGSEEKADTPADAKVYVPNFGGGSKKDS